MIVDAPTLVSGAEVVQPTSRLAMPALEQLPEELRVLIEESGEEALRALALSPQTLLRWIAYYSELMFRTDGSLSLPERELIATVVSAQGRCPIAVEHHATKLGQLIGDEKRARRIAVNYRVCVLSERERAIADFAAKASVRSSDICDADIDALRSVGLDDAGVFEVVEVTGAFSCSVVIENVLALTPSPGARALTIGVDA
jgi:uncharacterized peroxidase-related enzyme